MYFFGKPMNKEVVGYVNSIQTMGTLDGPGLRVVVFMQGCNMRCDYCHNPETWEPKKNCEVYTPEKLVFMLNRYRPYFGEKGGLTISGGEPLLQTEFVKRVFQLCHEDGINTCLDTAGGLNTGSEDELLEVCDLVMLDIKMTTKEDYRKYIHWDFVPVHCFLNKLTKLNVPTWIRQVIVEGVNDTEENIMRLNELLRGRENIKKVELLPFKKMCEVKYENLGIDFPFASYPQTSQETIDRLQKMIEIAH